MDSLNATISRLLENRRLPESAQEWIVPVAAASAAVAVGLGIALRSSNRDEHRPPVVPSWIPWLGSEWAVERDSDAFFKAAM